MNIFRRASLNSTRFIQNNQPLASTLFATHFSTEAESQEQKQNEAVDSFIRKPNSGLYYGRLQGITKYTTRSDVCNMLDGCGLTVDDVKVDYNYSFAPVAIVVQFPSRDAYEAGLRTTKRGRHNRLDPANRSAWDTVKHYEGRCILLQGIPRNALIDDVERFLSGCQYDSSSLRIFARSAFPDPIRMATVSFSSPALAMHACITKDRSYCLNNQISVRVLQ